MTRGEIAWRRCARSLLRLADQVATQARKRVSSPPKPIEGYLILASLFGRRLLSAIDCLGRESEYEASILLRTLLELWVNTQWISHEDSERRAELFFSFESVDMVKSMEQFPPSLRTGRFGVLYRQHLRFREQVAHEFQRPDGRWERTWARNAAGKHRQHLSGRIADLVRAEVIPSEDANRTSQYHLYSELSSRTHAAPRAFRLLMPRTLEKGRLLIADEPMVLPAAPVNQGCSMLLDLIAHTINRFDLVELDAHHARHLQRVRRLAAEHPPQLSPDWSPQTPHKKRAAQRRRRRKP